MDWWENRSFHQTTVVLTQMCSSYMNYSMDVGVLFEEYYVSAFEWGISEHFLTFRTIFRRLWKWSKIDFSHFLPVPAQVRLSGWFRPFLLKNGQKGQFWLSKCHKNFLAQLSSKSRWHAKLHLLNVVSFQNFPKWAIFAILAQFIETKNTPFNC